VVDVDIAPLEQEYVSARAEYAKWIEADISDIDAAAFRSGAASRKARVEAAEDALRQARDEAGRSGEQLMLIQKWPLMSNPEKRRWMQNFDVSVLVRRGKEPTVDRMRFFISQTPLDPSTVAGTAGH
jgi:hypothetical protein